MRIAIVSTPYVPVPPTKYGGTERVIYYLIKGLQKLGHEPILFAPADSQVDCEVVPICEKSFFFGKTEAEQKEGEVAVNAALLKTKELLRDIIPSIDVIHSHGFDLIDFQDFPNITTLHNKIGLPEMEYFEKRRNLYFVSISKNQQSAFPDLQYVGVAYNGLDPEEFPIVEQAEDYLCFLGRLDYDKSPHLAIELALKLGMKLKMAGKIDFKGENYFKEQIQPYLDNPLIEYMGELGMEEKITLVSEAKCNLHPTGFREPFGLSILEASYCGTPTLAIKRGSMSELIEDGRTGKLVEDFAEGYHAINECFGMDRQYIAQRARYLFNYETMAKQYLLAYEKVIQISDEKHRQEKIILDFMTTTKAEMEKVWHDKKA